MWTGRPSAGAEGAGCHRWEVPMIESVLIFLGKILFLFVFSSAILLSAGIILAVVVCAVGGCTCEVCRVIARRFGRSGG